MSTAIKNVIETYDSLIGKAQCVFIPVLLLFCRLWVAYVFFNSGLTKIATWDSTLYLFEYEYQVPLLPWQLAAYMGTAAELILPAFVGLGLLTRPMAAILFVFNIIAVVSYPLLWERGFYDHQLWGLMILIVIVWGAGPFSIDKLLKEKLKG
ncbi:DoxX family protein [Vibrio nereis]|uniref:DoxX family protein n=1 Tax=Vibrio nereis TaxID=693 RepID=UPI0024950D24|nr:DoxX family protein [Vibrio nereis]